MSQKEFDKEITEIKERFNKIERLIQESNEDEYCGWMMRKKKVQWFALQQRKRQQSMAWWKNEELKKANLEQRLIKLEEVHSCEHKVGSFHRENDGLDIKLKNNLMECSGS